MTDSVDKEAYKEVSLFIMILVDNKYSGFKQGYGTTATKSLRKKARLSMSQQLHNSSLH
jgi:hypothetical protein